MTKKIKSSLFVMLYIILYYVVRSAVELAVPIMRFIRDFASGERDFGTLFEEFQLNASIVTYDINHIAAVTSVVTALIFLIIILIRRRKINTYIKTAPLKMMHLITAVILTVGLNLIAIFIASLDIFSPLVPEYHGRVGGILGGNLYITLLVVGVIAPVFEEIMYRGMIFSELRTGFGNITANLMQAIIFGAMHGDIIQGTYAAAIGFILGLAYQKSGSIYFVSLVHILLNTANVLMASTSVFAGRQILLVVGILGCAAALYMLGRRR